MSRDSRVARSLRATAELEEDGEAALCGGPEAEDDEQLAARCCDAAVPIEWIVDVADAQLRWHARARLAGHFVGEQGKSRPLADDATRRFIGTAYEYCEATRRVRVAIPDRSFCADTRLSLSPRLCAFWCHRARVARREKETT